MGQEYSKDDFLTINHLSVAYHSDGQILHAVNDVSLKLKNGRSLGLIGETGAGKTTIAKAIMRILPSTTAHVSSGSIMMNDKDILQITETDMRNIRGKTISMIFQDPMTALNPVQRVGEQIGEVIFLHSDMNMSQAEKEAEKILEMVGIPGSRANDYPDQFSGGMKQRVVIAIALACNPALLIADEPTTALDVTIQAQILDIIKDLQKKLNTSIIMITHDFGVVLEVCDDVAVIYAGEIVESGSIEDIFDHTAHPYTKGLFAALPDLEKDMERLTPINGLPPDPTNLPSGCSFAPRCPYATEECRKNKIALREISKDHFCRCINI